MRVSTSLHPIVHVVKYVVHSGKREKPVVVQIADNQWPLWFYVRAPWKSASGGPGASRCTIGYTQWCAYFRSLHKNMPFIQNVDGVIADIDTRKVYGSKVPAIFRYRTYRNRYFAFYRVTHHDTIAYRASDSMYYRHFYRLFYVYYRKNN